MTTASSASQLPAVVAWDGKTLRLLDQTRLPAEEVYLDITAVAQLEDAILRLAVRGAPAIGCAAAFGVVLIARAIDPEIDDAPWLKQFDAGCEHLAQTRPTAVNLRWAVERCRKVLYARAEERLPLAKILEHVENEAKQILAEDRRMCERIGRHGAELLASTLQGRGDATVMTHCNAGALATGGMGTALAVFYAAAQSGLRLKVFADETRPLLQGARLTAWELARSGIDVTVICDNMAASVLRDKKPDAVVVGADRITANGDTANKIGTYGLAIMARHHGVPFYVAAPSSTYDFSLATGAQIPIEERPRKEIAEQNGKLAVPQNAKVFNPAFDVTPAELVSAHITECGVLKPSYSAENFRKLFASA